MNSRSPSRKKRRTEDSNVDQHQSAHLSLPKNVSGDGQIMPRSGNSNCPTVNVGNTRFAKMLMERSKRIKLLGKIGVYAVPLKTSYTTIGPATFRRFVFDVRASGKNGPSLLMEEVKEHKTILLVRDCGKASLILIDNIFNYIVDVSWNDAFRFILKGDQEEESISVYEIHHVDGFRIPFSLTIVDVPFHCDTPSKDFAEMMGNFLSCKNTIQQLDMIGIVYQENTLPTKFCESVLSFFGKDIKENLCHWTFADFKQDPPESNIFFEALPHHNFHNLEFLFAIGNCDPSPTAIYWKSFKGFFQSLAKVKPNRLTNTKQVLKVRKRLEVTFCDLLMLKENGLTLREKTKKTKKKIAYYQPILNANIYDIKSTRKTNLSAGFLATNCNNCGVTCSIHRTFETNTPSCSVCPKQCNWNSHSINVSYGLESSVRNVSLKLETYSENLEKLIAEEQTNSMNLQVLRFQVNVYVEEINKIALYPFLMTPENVDLMT